MAPPVAVVLLSPTECLDIRTYATAIRDWNRENGRQDKMNHNRGTDYEYELEYRGRIGEYALAKHLGVDYQFTLGYEANRDVAGYEVRTRSRHHYDLLTYADDRPGIYIHASTESSRLVMLHGWSTLEDTLRPERFADWMQRPCYLTPRSELYPMAFLPPATQHSTLTTA